MGKLLIFAGLALLLQLGTATRIVCYFTNWSQYCPGIGSYMLGNVDPVSAHTSSMPSLAWLTTGSTPSMEFTLHQYLFIFNTELKTLLSVGGWNFGTQQFSNMVATSESCQTFIQLAILFLRKFNFDGLDIGWEYLGNCGSPADTQQLSTVLLKKLYEAFEQKAMQSNKPRLLISAAMSAGKGTIETVYQIPEMSKYMDLINVMTYDLRGSWESFTGENSPLFAGPNDQGDYKLFNVDYAMNYWKNHGAPAEKLMVGFGAYASTFTFTNPADHGLDAPTSGPGAARPYTQEAYFEVCSFLKGANEVWNTPPQEAPYTYKGNQWIGYGDPKSFALKAEWLLRNSFGGAMVCAIDLDDFTGTFCGQGTYPLMNALKSALGVSTPNCRVPTFTLGTTSAPIVTAAPGGGSVGNSGFCVGKPSGLSPSATSKRAFYNCMGGHTYEEACQTGLVFDTSCSCYNWP
ncbi:acidic mammalian chitinase-like [Rhynchonycteris naso]